MKMIEHKILVQRKSLTINHYRYWLRLAQMMSHDQIHARMDSKGF